MLPFPPPDRIRIAFDDQRVVADAGLLLPMTLARRLGLGQLADELLDLGRSRLRPRRASFCAASAGGTCASWTA